VGRVCNGTRTGLAGAGNHGDSSQTNCLKKVKSMNKNRKGEGLGACKKRTDPRERMSARGIRGKWPQMEELGCQTESPKEEGKIEFVQVTLELEGGFAGLHNRTAAKY